MEHWGALSRLMFLLYVLDPRVFHMKYNGNHCGVKAETFLEKILRAIERKIGEFDAKCMNGFTKS